MNDDTDKPTAYGDIRRDGGRSADGLSRRHAPEDMGDESTFGRAAYCDGTCLPAYNDLTTVSECLMILADLNGHHAK